MGFIGAFLSALLATALVGAASKFLIGLFSESHPARFGGFCIALGFAIGRYSYTGPFDGHLLDAASAVAGAAIALAGLWYWLLSNTPAVHAGEPE